MLEELEKAKLILEKVSQAVNSGQAPYIERQEVVSHALLSAWNHHWPTSRSDELDELLKSTNFIKTTEHSRWMTQRRIAVAKLAQKINT